MWADNQALKLQRRAHIMWENDGPQTVFIVKKTGSAKTTAKLKEIATWQVPLQMCSLSGPFLHNLTALETCTSAPSTAASSSCVCPVPCDFCLPFSSASLLWYDCFVHVAVQHCLTEYVFKTNVIMRMAKAQVLSNMHIPQVTEEGTQSPGRETGPSHRVSGV